VWVGLFSVDSLRICRQRDGHREDKGFPHAQVSANSDIAPKSGWRLGGLNSKRGENLDHAFGNRERQPGRVGRLFVTTLSGVLCRVVQVRKRNRSSARVRLIDIYVKHGKYVILVE
jgi:hypothetical protein